VIWQCFIETRTLNQAVTRHLERFPDDFMFKLSKQETESLRSQIVILENSDSRFIYQPRVFTENGVAMLSTVLNTKTAIQVNIQIMRTFTKLKQLISSHKEIWDKIEAMEKKYDSQFKAVFDVLRQLLTIPEKDIKKIGFKKD
jgi:hypothetical protein